MRKISLLFAAALMAFTVQTAWAEDYDDDIDDVNDQIEESVDTGSFVRRWRGGPGHGPAMRGGMGACPMAQGCPAQGGGFGNRGGRQHGGRGFGGMRGGMRGGMMHGGMFGGRFMDELELTNDQKMQMVDIATANFRERLLAGMEYREAMTNLRKLHESDAPDHDAIIAANTAVGAAKGKLDVLDAKSRDQFKSVLTDEQVKKLEERRAERQKALQERRERRSEERGNFPGRHDGTGPRGQKLQRGPGPRM